MRKEDWDLTRGPRREPYYDGTGSGFIRDIPSYITFKGDDLAFKFERMCEHIRELRDDVTEDKLIEFENAITFEILERHGRSPVLSPTPASETPSCRPLKGSATRLDRLDEVEFEGAKWRSTDRPFLKLGERWLLASDDELQWVLYKRDRVDRWEAVKFPTTRDALLRCLIERDLPIPTPIIEWPDLYRDWLLEQISNNQKDQQRSQ